MCCFVKIVTLVVIMILKDTAISFFQVYSVLGTVAYLGFHKGGSSPPFPPPPFPSLPPPLPRPYPSPIPALPSPPLSLEVGPLKSS